MIDHIFIILKSDDRNNTMFTCNLPLGRIEGLLDKARFEDLFLYTRLHSSSVMTVIINKIFLVNIIHNWESINKKNSIRTIMIIDS